MSVVSRTIRQWWTRTNDTQLLQAQTQLLDRLVQAPMVAAGKSAEGLNTVTFESTTTTTTTNTNKLATVVLLHGFGSGLGFFYANIDGLLQSGQVGRVVLVDWIGMGGSDRPACRRPIRGLSECTTAWCQSRFSPHQAVDFFLDPLHSFLTREGLLVEQPSNNDHPPQTTAPPLWIVGHSLGGYLAARYLLRHLSTTPQPLSQNNTNMHSHNTSNWTKVLLASPVGFPIKPSNVLPSAQLPTPMRLVDALWSANVTPQQLVRVLGANRGRRAVQRALQGRIPHLLSNNNNNNVLELLADYLFHITVAHPSGEFAMNSLLEPALAPDMAGVFAREPLEPLFAEWSKSQQHINTCTNAPQLRVVFGDHDWMRPNQPSAVQALQHYYHSKAPSLSNTLSAVDVVPQAGHHLYLDNPAEFVKQILA